MSATRYKLIIADWLLPDGDGIYLADRADAWTLASDGTWNRVRPSGRDRRPSAQVELLERMRAKVAAP